MQNGKKTEIQRKRQEIQLQKYSLEYKNTNANTNTNTNTKMLECHCTPEEKVFFGNFLKLECQFKFSSLIFFCFSLLGNISHYIVVPGRRKKSDIVLSKFRESWIFGFDE